MALDPTLTDEELINQDERTSVVESDIMEVQSSDGLSTFKIAFTTIKTWVNSLIDAIKSTANTWTAKQTFTGEVVVQASVNANNPIQKSELTAESTRIGVVEDKTQKLDENGNIADNQFQAEAAYEDGHLMRKLEHDFDIENINDVIEALKGTGWESYMNLATHRAIIDYLYAEVTPLNYKTQNITTSGEVTPEGIQADAVTIEKLSQAVLDYINASGGGTITNAPDDVDLETKTGGLIGLKNSSVNGTIIRNVSDFKAAITEGLENKTYIIAGNIDLTSETSELTLPPRTEIMPRGGVIILGNYNLIVNTCIIEEKAVQIFQYNGTGVVDGKISSANVYFEWWGAKGDGVTVDTLPIKQCISAVRADESRNAIAQIKPAEDNVNRIRMLSKAYVIDEPIDIYAGINLIGNGVSSGLYGTSSFSGDDMIRIPVTSSGILIDNIRFINNGASGIRAVGIYGGLLNSIITNLYIGTDYGVICVEDSGSMQFTRVENLFSYGFVEQIFNGCGNFNFLINIDKEAETGSNSESYVLIREQSFSESTGDAITSSYWTIDNFLAENVASPDKSPLELRNCNSSTVTKIWNEISDDELISPEIRIKLNNCTSINFTDFIKLTGYGRKISVTESTNILFKHISTASFLDDGLADVFIIDDTSDVEIDTFVSRQGAGAFKQYDNIIVNKVRTTQDFDGYSNRNILNKRTSTNLLSNASFENGIRDWRYIQTTPRLIEEFIDSEVGLGKMLHLGFNDGNYWLVQDIVIPEAFVGNLITFGYKVKGIGDANVVPSFSGGGITLDTGADRSPSDGGWHHVSQTFKITESGSAVVGVFFIGNVANETEWWIDDFTLQIGKEATTGGEKFKELWLDGKTILQSDAYPTIGDWSLGDIVYNSNYSYGQYLGWKCDGVSPLFWTGFGTEGVGTTADRPSSPVIGFKYLDTTLGYLIAYNGSNWVDGSGNIV